MKAFSLANKLITTAVNGKNETRFLRIWFQLLPEMNDVRVNRAVGAVRVGAPDGIEQLITRADTAAVAQQRDDLAAALGFARASQRLDAVGAGNGVGALQNLHVRGAAEAAEPDALHPESRY